MDTTKWKRNYYGVFLRNKLFYMCMYICDVYRTREELKASKEQVSVLQEEIRRLVLFLKWYTNNSTSFVALLQKLMKKHLQ